jgi:tRNA(adenine34) deaminase
VNVEPIPYADRVPSTTDDDAYMDSALEAARAAPLHADVPVGAVVVRDGQVIASAHNRREIDGDPTAHAEIIAIREAAAALHRWRLQDCALYVTVEPCAMCCGAAILARIALVVFAAPEKKTGAVLSTIDLFDDPRSLHHPTWRMGARRDASESLLADFFGGRRHAPGPA